jgi:uncharacterized membrane protein (DUF2068 family)
VSEVETHDAEPARSWADPLSGLFAAIALFFSLLALAYHPLTVSVTAFLLGLLSVLMSARHERLAGIALGVAGLSFVAGMTIAIVTDKPLW